MLFRALLCVLPLLTFVTACGDQTSSSSSHQDTSAVVADSDPIVVEVREVETTPEETAHIAALYAAKAEQAEKMMLTDPMQPGDLDTSAMTTESVDIATIINIAKEVWTIIEKNAPVVNITTDYATAVPAGVTDLMAQMSHFSELKSKSYEWIGKNLFNGEVFRVRYTVVNQFGGRYEGRGRYLTTVGIIPSEVKVAWGYKLDFVMRQVSITNIGLENEPIASVTLDLQMKAKSPLKHVTHTRLYQIRGDNGKIIEK